MLDTIQIIVHGTCIFLFLQFCKIIGSWSPERGSQEQQAAANGLCAMCAASDGHGDIHWPGHAHILIQFHSISAYLMHVTLRRGLIFQENTILPLWKGEYFPLGSLWVHNALWTRASVTLGGQQCQPMRGRHCQAPTNQSLVFPGPGSATRVLRFYPRADLSSHWALTAKRG